MDKVADMLGDKEAFVTQVKNTLDSNAFKALDSMKKELAAEFIKDIENDESV